MEFIKKIEHKQTQDGSLTLIHPTLNEGYHSLEGAVEEAKYVYIESALHAQPLKEKKVFEMGFGTGLNALLSLVDSIESGDKIIYHAVELYPIDFSVLKGLNYVENISNAECGLTSEQIYEFYEQLHSVKWGEEVKITDTFTIKKLNGSFFDIDVDNDYNVIFWDAFSFDTQPELWSERVFKRVFDMCSSGAVLSTYSSKGDVKRALRSAGFQVKRKKGFSNKRHMITGVIDPSASRTGKGSPTPFRS